MLRYVALPTSIVRAYQAGGPDAFGRPPERAVSDGEGNPCRHCLRDVPDGDEMLILAHKPFGSVQPYAEVGPIFLCAGPCERGGGFEVPEIFAGTPDYLLKGYTREDRIAYDTGGIVATAAIPERAEAILRDPRVAYVHVRSARNNCYQLRIDQGG